MCLLMCIKLIVIPGTRFVASDLPWFDVFYKMLNFLAEIINRSENNDLMPFVRAAYEQSIPMADEPVTIVAGQDVSRHMLPTC